MTQAWTPTEKDESKKQDSLKKAVTRLVLAHLTCPVCGRKGYWGNVSHVRGKFHYAACKCNANRGKVHDATVDAWLDKIKTMFDL